MNTAPAFSPERTEAPRIREALEDMGPTFVKVGQFLATRPDLIPAEYCDELLLLTDRHRPLPFQKLRGVVEEELGDPADRFAFLDPEPLAAGSLAQIHLARTHEGDEVAVKIQRPGIEAALQADLRKSHAVARVLDLLGVSRTVSAEQVTPELEQWLGEELDFEAELRHLVRMRALCADSDLMVVPRPYRTLSSRHVLTCKLLRGMPLSEILRHIRAGRADLVTDAGYDLDRLATNLLESVLIQIFDYRFFHADIHPANLLALPGDRIGMLDLALVDTLDPVVRKGTAEYLTAMLDQDLAGMQRAATDVLHTTEDSDLDAFRAELTAEMRSLIREREHAADGAHRPQRLREDMVRVVRIARAKGLVVPPGMISLHRSLLAAEAIAAQLSAEADLMAVGRCFFRRQQLETLMEEMSSPVQAQRFGLQLVKLMQDGPGQLARLLEDLADERFVLRVRSADAAERQRQHDARARLVTLGLVAVSVSLLLVGAFHVPSFGWLPLRVVLAVVLAAVYVALAIQWRRLR